MPRTKRKASQTDDLDTSSYEDSSQDSFSEAEKIEYRPYNKKQNNNKRVPAIRKDGMAICEVCGDIGVRDAFYSNLKKFCSMICSRASAAAAKAPSNKVSTMSNPSIQMPNIQKSFDKKACFKWESYLQKENFVAAPVSCFKHVPFSNSWHLIRIGTKLEIERSEFINGNKVQSNTFWLASIVRVEGYFAKLRYEGYEDDSSNDFWINLCTEKVYPVSWCASNKKKYKPPKYIIHLQNDWKVYLTNRLIGAWTLPLDFHDQIKKGNISKFKPRMILEVVDKNYISAVRVARVLSVIGGRLRLSYGSTDEEHEEFWVHERSPMVHPVGWSQIVGHDLRDSNGYGDESLKKILENKFDAHDAIWDLFVHPQVNQTALTFEVGMKLEAIDPLNQSKICVATVAKKLRNNYLMIGIDGIFPADESDWFCYHASSPCIFPAGFCYIKDIHITPPQGYKREFIWHEYLTNSNAKAAPVALFKKEILNHGFKEGMLIEVVDLMEPYLICVGTIINVVDRLLRIHFNGWDETYDQWCDCESPDIFPIGWCEMVGYKLEHPGRDESHSPTP